MSGLAIAIDRIARALVYVATGAGVLLTGFVALSAMMRYVVGSPFAFTEELVGLLFVALVFLALPFCSLRDRHIRVTLVSDLLPAAWRGVGHTLGQVCVIVFCLVYGRFAFEFAALSFRLNSVSDIGQLTLWPWMGIMPLACALMGLVTIMLLLRRGKPEAGDDTADKVI